MYVKMVKVINISEEYVLLPSESKWQQNVREFLWEIWQTTVKCE